MWRCFDGNLIKMKIWQILNRNLLVSVAELRVVVSVSNTDTIPPGIARLIPIPRVSLNSRVLEYWNTGILEYWNNGIMECIVFALGCNFRTLIQPFNA